MFGKNIQEMMKKAMEQAMTNTSMPMHGAEEAMKQFQDALAAKKSPSAPKAKPQAAQAKPTESPLAVKHSQDTTKGNPFFQPLAGGLEWVDDSRVRFGSYPQTKSGGVEKILWRVLEKKNGQLLLVSEYVLDNKKWHDEPNRNFPKSGKKEDMAAAITDWEHCDLRKWLNGSFTATPSTVGSKAKSQNG